MNKTVLITGASSGIGKASAKIFAQNGWDLILTARREMVLQKIKEELQGKYDVKVTQLIFDVRNRKAVDEHMNQLKEMNPRIDVLINNAGLAKGKAEIHECDIDDWETMIDTNIKGLLYMTRSIAPLMVSNHKGHIINVASSAAHEVYPGGNVYCASKFAVKALTKSMRLDLYKYNVRVSQISPGHVEETDFAVTRFNGDQEKAKIYEDFIPLNSTDVAEIIYFIASRKKHINIEDVIVMGTQQASNVFIDRSGR